MSATTPYPVSPLNPARRDRRAQVVRELSSTGYGQLRSRHGLPAYDFLWELDPELGSDIVQCLIERRAYKLLRNARSACIKTQYPNELMARAELRRHLGDPDSVDNRGRELLREALRQGWTYLLEWWGDGRADDSGWGHAATVVYQRGRDWLEAHVADVARQLKVTVGDTAIRGGWSEPVTSDQASQRNVAMPGRDPFRQLLTKYERKLDSHHARRMPAMVDELPTPERDVISLHLQGLSVTETAERLDMKERAVKYRREQGLRMLDAILNDYTEKVCRVDPDLNRWVGKREWA